MYIGHWPEVAMATWLGVSTKDQPSSQLSNVKKQCENGPGVDEDEGNPSFFGLGKEPRALMTGPLAIGIIIA